jgi:hypothetical protein
MIDTFPITELLYQVSDPYPVSIER